MGKIRKKSSARQSSRMVKKISKKVADHKKKEKKLGKKDVTWKSNKPKEIGIPSMFPFKDEILAEAAAEKVRKEEEKIAKREAQRAMNGSGATLASTAALAAALAADSQRLEDELAEAGGEVDEENLVSDPSLKLHAKSLRKVLEASDVLIEVLDARDPVGTRCRAVERELKSLDGGRKKLILVLNKIDLVPPPVVQAWLAHLRLQAPTLAFKSSTQQQRNHLSASSVRTPTTASGSSTKPLMELIKGFRLGASSASGAGEQKVKQSLTIGLIGHPNVGKSSLINTLKRSKACAVAPTPGWTKEVQEVVLEKGVRVLDCPGVVVEARGETEGALRGMIKPEDIVDVIAPIDLILQRCKKEHLMMLYNIPTFAGTTQFLVEVARGKGRLKKGGVPDLQGTARSILRDWVSGRIPYYTSPPAAAPIGTKPSTPATTILDHVTEDDLDSATLLTSFAPAFDLAALFGEADALAFGELDSKDAPRGVKMDGIVADSEDANVGWAMEEEADEDEEDDDAINVDDLIEDDDEEVDDEEDDGVDVDDMEEDEPAPAAVTRSNRASQRTTTNNIVSVAPPLSKKLKSVSFANKPLGPTPTGTSSAISQRAKLFAPNDVEAPVSLNKDIRKNAKKDKKKARKVERGVEMELEDFVAETPLSKPSKPVRPMGAADEAYSFEEFFPSNNSGRRVPMEQEDMDED